MVGMSVMRAIRAFKDAVNISIYASNMMGKQELF
jgi:hypothetical protein